MTKVLVRVSPSSSDKCFKSTSTSQLRVECQNNSEQLNFQSIGNEFCSQQDIFNEIELPIIDNIQKRSNEIVIILGQKDSGKTNTLFGSNSKDKGLISMLVESFKHKGYESSLSCYQILNEKIFDLLSCSLKTKQLTNINNQLRIVGLSQTKLNQNQNVEEILATILKNCKSVKLNLQNQLDKSTVIVTLNIKQQDLIKNKIIFVKLPEYKINDKSKQQSKIINKSTDSFIKMIESSQIGSYYPQSKLTQIIRYQMQKKCGIHVIAHIRPQKRYLSETLFTLDLANKSKKLGINQKNISQPSEFQNLQTQLINNGTCRNHQHKINKDISDYEFDRMIKHQNHLKNIIMLYQNRYQIQKSQFTQFQKQKKLLQQLTNEYFAFFKNSPTFSQIISQNIQSKQQSTKQTFYSPSIISKDKMSFTPMINSVSSFDNPNYFALIQTVNKQNKILQQYQSIISIFKQQFISKLSQLSLQYSHLQRNYHNSLKIQQKPSIRNFINQEQEIDILKTQIQLLKQQNNKLRSKNRQLEVFRQKQGLTLFELDHIKEKLLQIQNSIVRQEQTIRNQCITQIAKVKQFYTDRSEIKQQQNVTLKKFNISSKPTHKTNDTSQTFFLTQTNRNIPTQSYLNKYRISISKSIDDNDKLQTTHVLSNSHRVQDVSILQSSHIRSQRSYYNSTQKMIKPQKKQRSQLERLRLLLLKSKQKTQRTKLNSQESSIKNSINNIVYSKSSIFQRTQYSTLSRKYKNKPQITVEMSNKIESKIMKDFVGFRLRNSENKY